MTKETKPKLNVSLLRRIIRHLSEEPKRYNQSQWGIQVDPAEKPEAPACGTQGCIAGWAVLLNVPQELWGNLFAGEAFSSTAKHVGNMRFTPATEAAQRLLGLTNDEALCLFASLNQTCHYGMSGVNEAKQKINALIRDRATFVLKYR